MKERLEREQRRRDTHALMRDLRAIGERCAARLKPGPSAIEHGDCLYDEHGVPKGGGDFGLTDIEVA